VVILLDEDGMTVRDMLSGDQREARDADEAMSMIWEAFS
jgi:hypothetical protein